MAPGLWPLEALNGLLVAERRGQLDASRRQRLAGFLHALPISLDGETASQAWTTTVSLAERFALSAYDAPTSRMCAWVSWTTICSLMATGNENRQIVRACPVLVGSAWAANKPPHRC